MEYDVIVVGKGNAALCAALSAQENGAKVLMLEAASEDEHGGNSRFAGGVMRFAYETVDDLRRVTEISDEEAANTADPVLQSVPAARRSTLVATRVEDTDSSVPTYRFDIRYQGDDETVFFDV